MREKLNKRELIYWTSPEPAWEKINIYLKSVESESQLWKKPESKLEDIRFRAVFEKDYLDLCAIGFYCDYRFTWDVGKLHFSFLLYKLSKGDSFWIYDLVLKEKKQIRSINQFINWLEVEGNEYIRLINDLVK